MSGEGANVGHLFRSVRGQRRFPATGQQRCVLCVWLATAEHSDEERRQRRRTWAVVMVRDGAGSLNCVRRTISWNARCVCVCVCVNEQCLLTLSELRTS